MRLIFCGMVFLQFAVIFPENFEILREGELEVKVQKDPNGRLTKMVQGGVETGYFYDSQGQLEKIYRDGSLEVEYIRTDHDADLIILTKEYRYWFKRRGRLLEYGEFNTDRSGYRLYNDERKCIYEKFLNGACVSYERTKDKKRITLNRDIAFEIDFSSSSVVSSKGEAWDLKEGPVLGEILEWDPTGNPIKAECGGVLQHYGYDEEDQLVFEQIGDLEIHHNYIPGRIKISSDNINSTHCEDSLQRCTHFSMSDDEIYFDIDPFGRVLSMKEKGGSLKKFIYEDWDEIGCIEEGKLKEFRFLKKEEGTDEARTVFIYKEGRGYKVWSDLWGNIVRLQEPGTNEIKEELFYSAFRELKGCTNPISPWRYRGKRAVQNLEISIFPLRIYAQKEGRFLTCDPIGFDFTLNRTVYCLNNPLRYSDPKGGWVGFHLTRSQKYAVGSFIDFLGKHLPLSLSLGQKLQTFGAQFMGLEDPENYEMDQVFEINSHLREDKLAILFVNGISTEKPVVEHLCYDLSTRFNQKVRCVHLATQGSGRDLLNSAKEYLGIKTHGAILLEDLLRSLLADKEKKLIIFSHSRGALTTDLALKNFTEEQKERIEVFSFGGACLIPRKSAKRVVNFISKGDPIPFLIDFKSYVFGEKYFDVEIVRLDIEKGGLKYFDHAILGATYRKCLDNLVKEYLTQYSA